MGELLTVLVVLGFALGVVAVIGHGLWVFAALVLRTLAGQRPEPPPEAARSCPQCDSSLQAGATGCAVCGWPLKLAEEVRQAKVLRAVQQELDRFGRAGLIEQASLARITDAVGEEQRRLQPATELVNAELVTFAAAPISNGQSPFAEATAAAPSVADQLPCAGLDRPASQAEDFAMAPAVLTPADRVQQYMARQTALTQMPPEEVAAAPKRQARPWSEIFKAFLEEKNIRWGELVGGLMIVCCSIALVISFWSAIAEQPFLKFFVFNGVTAGLFGVGFYAQHRLKLPTTGQGLLLVATLLAPLNFLAIAAFSRGPAPTDAFTLGGELVSIGIFATLVYFAGKVVASPWPLSLVLGVMGSSIAQLLVRRYIVPEAETLDLYTLRLYTLGALPLACFGGSIGWALWPRPQGSSHQDEATFVHAMLRLLGLTAFAALLPWGLLLVKSGQPVATMQLLAPLVSLSGVPLLAAGLSIARRATGSALAALQTAAIAVAVLGALIWLAGIPLAWPDPSLMLAVSAIGFVLFTAVAWRYAMAPAQLLACACLSLAVLLCVHVLSGSLGWQEQDPGLVARVLASASSGVTLIPLSFLFAAAAAVASRKQRVVERFVPGTNALYYAASAAGVSLISLALVTWYGFAVPGDPSGATWVYALYALLALAAAAVTGRAPAAWCGGLLALAALVQAVVYRYGDSWELSHPWQWALLTHAGLIVALAVLGNLARRRFTIGSVASIEALAHCGLITSVAACVLVLSAFSTATAALLAVPLLGLAVVWLALSWLMRWPWLFTAFQAALSAAVAVGVTARLESEAWFQSAERPRLDPWNLQAQAVALAVLALGWIAVRIAAARWIKPAEKQTLALLLNPTWPAFDRVMNVLLLLAMVALAIYGALPGVAQELTPRNLALELSGQPISTAGRIVPPLSAFELDGIPHEHALGFGTWLLAGLLGVVFFAGQWERYSPWRVFGIVILGAMACPLLAAVWTPDVAAASALRWLAAGFLLLGSAVVWCREPLAQWTARLGWPGWGAQPAALSRDCRTLLLAVVVLLLTAMGAYVALAAVLPSPIDAGVASALPWLAITFAVLGIVAMGLRMTPHTIFAGQRVQGIWQTWSRQVSLLLLILGAAPLVAVSLFVVTMALRGNPIVGPDPAGVFFRMGLAPSYAVPILLIALSLVGHAVRECSASFAFAAGLLFNTAATAGYLLALGRSGAALDAALWVQLAQLNALVSAVYALAWLGATFWTARRSGVAVGQPAPAALLVTQVMLPTALTMLVLVPAGVSLWWNAFPGAAHLVAGQWLGWAGFAATLAAGVWLARISGGQLTAGWTWATLAAVATLAAMSAAPRDTGNWLAFHTLMIGQVAAGGLLLSLFAIAAPGEHSTLMARRSVGRWCAGAALLVGCLSLRSAADDPQRPWWSLGALLATAVMLSAAAGWARRQRLLYLAAAGLNLAASIGWIERWWPTGPSSFVHGVIELLEINALALALPVIVWAAIELRCIRPALAPVSGRRALPMHATAAFLSLLMLGGMVGVGLFADLAGDPLSPRAWVGWAALAVSLMAMTACLWDVTLRTPLFGLYVLGLVAVGMTVDQFNLQPARWLVWTGAMVAGAYALGTSYLWSRRTGLRTLADAVGIPRPSPTLAVEERPLEERGAGWLVPMNGVLIAAVLAAAYWVDLTFPEQSLRLLTAKTALVQTLSMGLLARGAKRSLLQTLALSVGVIAAVAWGWAWLDPETTGTLLNRAVVATAALATMIALYGLGLAKLLSAASEWTRAARRLVPALIVLAGVSLGFILATEAVFFYEYRAVPISPLAIAVVAAALAGLVVAALAAAVLPGRDPLGLSERGRTLYVYGAEVLLALLFLHIRLTMPWLFHGFFTKYWTFVVVLLAFLGVGLSEFFARRRQRVLAEPLERTGAFLPLLPVIGFWAQPAGDYSLLLFSVGAVYATLAVMRKSFGFGVLAAVMANGGMWFFLHRLDGFGLLEHPQLWCIPPAVCVLVAAWINRDRLSAEQMNSVRYLASMTIYVSSTADIFLQGVAQAPWLPLVLAGISILGIFTGILMRVRSFLFLGTSFLMLALLTIIWHAAHDLEQTWIWAASGIVAGMAIIALFALFEKKRQEVLRLVDQIKEWE